MKAIITLQMLFNCVNGEINGISTLLPLARTVSELASTDPITVSTVITTLEDGFDSIVEGLRALKNDSETTPPTTTAPTSGEGNTVRLVGGDGTYGRVEILHNGEWGAVCKIWYDGSVLTRNFANVVCRSLRLGPMSQFVKSKEKVSEQKLWLDNVECTGTEVRLEDCPSVWLDKNRKKMRCTGTEARLEDCPSVWLDKNLCWKDGDGGMEITQIASVRCSDLPECIQVSGSPNQEGLCDGIYRKTSSVSSEGHRVYLNQDSGEDEIFLYWSHSSGGRWQIDDNIDATFYKAFFNIGGEWGDGSSPLPSLPVFSGNYVVGGVAKNFPSSEIVDCTGDIISSVDDGWSRLKISGYK